MGGPKNLTTSSVDADVAEAWYEYLEATRGQPHDRYREVEPWAWKKLTNRLFELALARRRARATRLAR